MDEKETAAMTNGRPRSRELPSQDAPIRWGERVAFVLGIWFALGASPGRTSDEAQNFQT